MKQGLAGAPLYFFIPFMWKSCLYKLHYTLVEQFWGLQTRENQWNLDSIKTNCKTLVVEINPGPISEVKKKKKLKLWQETAGQKSHVWEHHISGENSCKGFMNINTSVTIVIMREWDSDLVKSGKDIYLVSIFVTAAQYISTLWLQNNLYFFSMGDYSNCDNAFFQIK